MAKPIIMTVDDEPQVLNAVERDLRRHFRNEYRMIKVGSGSEALDVVRQLKQRNDPVALFLVDQRMPHVSGTEFLAQAMKLYPDARKVLLTAYADTEAAIDSINSIGLDHYLLKPWDPPEQNLYPVLDDLLSDWWQSTPPPFDGIRVAGTLWSPKSHDVKDFLARNRIPYLWLDIDQDAAACELVDGTLASLGGATSARRLPVVFFPDGTTLVEPDLRALAEKAGLRTVATQPFYDLIVVGAGPAGLGAAVYGASEGLRTLMIDKQATGGQAGTSSRIENYLGFPKGLSGADLAQRATVQATRLGAEILTTQEAVKVRVEEPNRYVLLADGTELELQSANRRHRRHRAAAGCAGRGPAHWRGRLLRRGADRGGQLPRAARLRGGRRQLGRPGRDVLLALRQPGDHAGAPRGPAGHHVAVPDRPDRRHAQHRGAYLQRGDRGPRRRAAGRADPARLPQRRDRERFRRLRCSCSSAPCRTRS